MDYTALRLSLREHNLYLFTLQDVKNLFPKERAEMIKNNLSRWQALGYFTRLKRDLYEFVDRAKEPKIPDLYVANRLYEPSYVSLEAALSFYSIIPDIAAGVTSVTTKPTRKFKNRYGSFFYRTCRAEAFTGYGLMLYEGVKVYIADKEKALVDFLYYRLRTGISLDFNEERFNKKILKKMDWKKVFRYARLFNKKTSETMARCREYAKC